MARAEQELGSRKTTSVDISLWHPLLGHVLLQHEIYRKRRARTQNCGK